MADFNVRDAGTFGFEVSEGGSLIASMEFRRGLPIPSLRSRPQVLKTYTYADGTTREVPWEMVNSAVRFRPGGATLRLGDHPYAKELASLGLPKRPMVSGSVGNVDMTFGEPNILS